MVHGIGVAALIAERQATTQTKTGVPVLYSPEAKCPGRGSNREQEQSAMATFWNSCPIGKELCTMLVEDGRIHQSLQQIVTVLTRNEVLHPDLLQECLIHLWKLESQKPGQTRSWYLQNCRYHVLHWLASGRSVDSLKRNTVDKRITIDAQDDEPALGEYHTNGDLFERVSFRDVVSTVGSRLKPRERRVLNGLANGKVLREIASELRLSYPTALKSRRTIAQMVTKLGISPGADGGKGSLGRSRRQSRISETVTK